MSAKYSKKKSVVWAEKNIIHNLADHPLDSDQEYQRDAPNLPSISIGNFNESRGEAKQVKPILKKQGGTGGLASPAQIQNVKVALPQNPQEENASQQISQQQTQPSLIRNNKSTGGKKSILNIRQKFKQALDEKITGSQKIRESAKEIQSMQQLESKSYDNQNLQKYNERQEDDYAGGQHLLDPLDTLKLKSPNNKKFSDEELKEEQQQFKQNVKPKFTLPQIKPKNEQSIQSQQENVMINQNFVKNPGKTQFDDASLLKTVKESLNRNQQDQGDRLTTATSQSTQAKPTPQQQQQQQQPQKPSSAQRKVQIIEQEESKQPKKELPKQKPFVKFLSTTQNYKPVNVQVISADQLPAYYDDDQEIKNLEKEIAQKREFSIANESAGLSQIMSQKSNNRKRYEVNAEYSAGTVNEKKMFQEKQKYLLETIDQTQSLASNFTSMFTSQNMINAQIEKHQKELQEKQMRDQPAFENPRESIKSFTESLSNQKSALADLLKRRAIVDSSSETTKSMPRIRSMAKIFQQKDFFKYDNVFSFENRYKSNKRATEIPELDKEELMKLKRKYQNPIKEEQTYEYRIILNQYLLMKFNIKQKWLQQIDISEHLFSRFPTICDLKNGQVAITGGLSFQDDKEYVSDALLFDSRNYEIEKLQNMGVGRYKHASVECDGSIFVIGGLGRGGLAIKIVEAFDVKLNPDWRRCASMGIERSEFFACSCPDSPYIYVFGGTMSKTDKYTIERYHTKDDKWEFMNVKLTDKFPYFDLFDTCCLLSPLPEDRVLISSMSNKEDKIKGDLILSREEQLIQHMLTNSEQAPQTTQAIQINDYSKSPNGFTKFTPKARRFQNNQTATFDTEVEEKLPNTVKETQVAKLNKNSRLQINVKLNKAKENAQKRLIGSSQSTPALLQQSQLSPQSGSVVVNQRYIQLETQKFPDIIKQQVNSIVQNTQINPTFQEPPQLKINEELIFLYYKQKQLQIIKFNLETGQESVIGSFKLKMKDYLNFIHMDGDSYTNILRRLIGDFITREQYQAQLNQGSNLEPAQFKQQILEAKQQIREEQEKNNPSSQVHKNFRSKLTLNMEIMANNNEDGVQIPTSSKGHDLKVQEFKQQQREGQVGSRQSEKSRESSREKVKKVEMRAAKNSVQSKTSSNSIMSTINEVEMENNNRGKKKKKKVTIFSNDRNSKKNQL